MVDTDPESIRRGATKGHKAGMMDIEEKAEFVLGILEREADRVAKEYVKAQLTWAEPITFPNSSELLLALNLALEELELEESAD